MVRVRVESRLAAPAERVWAVLCDFGNIADWVDDLRESAIVAGEGMAPGTARVAWYNTPVNGQPSIREVLTEVGDMEFRYDIPEGLTPYRRGGSHWRVVPDGDGCTVVFDTVLERGGLQGWLFAPLARAAVRKGITRAMRRLEKAALALSA